MSTSIAAAKAAPKAKAPRRFGIKKGDNLAGYLFVGPWLFGFLALTVIPMAASFFLSFTNYDILSPPKWVGLQNFKKMFFEDPRYWKSVGATIYYALAAVPLRLVVALAVAMLLNAKRRGVAFYRALFYAPSVVGDSVAVAVMWRQIFGGEGLINAFLRILGLPGKRLWLADPHFAIWTLILLAAWQFGSAMLIFLAGLKQIPFEFYESADMDGAGSFRKFFSITLPQLTPIIFFNLVMQTINGLIVFTPALIITNGQPLDTTNFYALYLYRRGFENFQMGYASGMAWVLMLVTALLTLLIFKTSSRWVFYESEVK
ncbi:MAG: sugar ABC transporter permease [Spirochaetes bacterium]|nr:sugar ABC transporter permease [Spirochaetota bacterium]